MGRVVVSLVWVDRTLAFLFSFFRRVSVVIASLFGIVFTLALRLAVVHSLSLSLSLS